MTRGGNSMSENDILKTGDIDLATFLITHGYRDYEIESTPNGILFVFKGPNVQEVAKQFPESDVNRILSTYYGLRKILRMHNNF